MRKVLLTGGAGFIGSAVVKELVLKERDTVLNVDALTYAGFEGNLSTVSANPNYQFYNVDIRDQTAICKIIMEFKPDLIMHLAAETHVDRSIHEPRNFIETNIIGTYSMLEASKKYWMNLDHERQRRFRFHHISTDEVYGDLPHPEELDQPIKGLPLFTENSAYSPSSPYSASKASSDHLVRAWHKTYGLPVLITNCSNNYGPYQYPEKLIPLIIMRAISGESLPIYGKGNQIRDWLYVEDHARALVLASRKGIVGETYNIGGHNEKKNIDVVYTICEILETMSKLHRNSKTFKAKKTGFSKLITHVEDRPGHDTRYAIDASKIERQLGWKPTETFESGIRKTVEWYVDNLDYCKSRLDKKIEIERLGVARSIGS